ncbi:MAG TPA: APC family permease [Candidatus Binatia bacterium]|nr:APC family permease [Candidatus Binatia bacterium]
MSLTDPQAEPPQKADATHQADTTQQIISAPPSWRERLRTLLIGRAKDPLAPDVFRHVSLVAFLAWVGLGSDGLSSSCYGPEEAFLALGSHTFLALVLALLMAVTVFVISASYSQIIELFPTGGGGYLVATKLLGRYPGLVAGCALLVDYVLTITISIASGADAFFSFLPLSYQPYKLWAATLAIGILIVLNLRGVKESVTVLVPIFMVFLLTHVLVIVYGIAIHLDTAATVVSDSFRESQASLKELGMMGMGLMLLRAYSLGGGTYTGIEAVSNGLPILREPRVETGKRTMIYMATSLAFTASGLLLAYLLARVQAQTGKTLNASLITSLAQGWDLGGVPWGTAFFLLTMLSESAILFVAAQTGFLGGPQVLANMALDSWVPRRFYQLSERLVTHDGVLLMGIAALALLFYANGDVHILVVLYSINVFLTFSLSQLGMCRHWWQVRSHEPTWYKHLWINGTGLVLTSGILIATVSLKFSAGGWVTVVLTSAVVGLCLYIKYHYREAEQALRQLDEVLLELPLPEEPAVVPARDTTAPTAAFFVNGFNGLGIHSVLAVPRLFGTHFKNFMFISVGVIDSSRFKGREEIDNLRRQTEENLERYVNFVKRQGAYAEYWYALGTDPIDELEELAHAVARRFPRTVFFAGKLVFAQEGFWHKVLHNQAAFTLQRRLQFAGMQMVVLPIRAMPEGRAQPVLRARALS